MDNAEVKNTLSLKKLVPLTALALAILVTAALYLPYSLVKLAFLGIIALPVAFFLLDKPRLLFFALVFILFSNLDVFFPFRLYRLVLFVFLNSFAIAVIRGRKIIIHDKVFAFLTIAFVIVAVQSVIAARNLDLALLGINRFLKVVLVLAITAQFVSDRKSFRSTIYVVAIGIAVSSFLPFLVKPPAQYSTASMIWSKGVFRYEGFVFEPNMLALVQVFFISILIFAFYILKEKVLLRLLVVLAIIGSILVLIMTFSRSGFVSLVFLFIIFLIMERKNKVILATGLSIIAVGLIMAPPVYWERISSIFTIASNIQEDLAIVSRIAAMKVSLMLWLKNPILGVGMENFTKNATFYVPYEIVVHNSFLQVLAELGTIGILVFTSLFFYNLSLVFKLIRAGDEEASQLGRILFAMYIAVFVDGLFLPIGYELILWFTMFLPSLAFKAYMVGSTGRKKSLLL